MVCSVSEYFLKNEDDFPEETEETKPYGPGLNSM